MFHDLNVCQNSGIDVSFRQYLTWLQRSIWLKEDYTLPLAPLEKCPSRSR